MHLIFDTYKKTKQLHHAYLIEDDGGLAFEKLTAFIQDDMGIATQGNPDVWFGSFEKFGIDEGRMVRELQASRPVVGDKRIFVITTQFFTREAQNALLKVFEEPTSGTHFFIITPSASALLPTLRSRLLIISRESSDTATVAQDTSTETARAFISGDVKARGAIVAPLVESKDKNDMIRFLNALEQELEGKGVAMMKDYTAVLEDIIRFRGYLYGNAPSVKMMAEHLTLAIPRR